MPCLRAGFDGDVVVPEHLGRVDRVLLDAIEEGDMVAAGRARRGHRA